MRFTRFALATVGTAAALAGGGLAVTGPAMAAPRGASTFLGGLHHTKQIVSTVPANGDVNPYGVAVIRHSHGRLRSGSVLVSNFNDSKNLQGTGSTIVEISPGGHRTQFAHISKHGLPGACPGGIGLTTALVIIHNWVFVGSLPSTNGQAATSKAGCIVVLDSQGHVRETISGHGINGPWDATAVTNGSHAMLFVTNVLNGTVAKKGKVAHGGTVLRLGLWFSPGYLPSVLSSTIVGSGFSEQTNSTTFVVAPTGLGLGRHGKLYVADTGQNRITMISHAIARVTSDGTGTVVTHGGLLSSPLGLTVVPSGDVLTVNGANGKIVETTPAGKQVASHLLDKTSSPPGNGALFGLGLTPTGKGVYYVDDAANTLRLLF